MRLLTLVAAAVLALTSCVAQEDPPQLHYVEDPDSPPTSDGSPPDVMAVAQSVLLALDTAQEDPPQLQYVEDPDSPPTSTSDGPPADVMAVAQSVLLALDTVPDDRVKCNDGNGGGVRVLFGVRNGLPTATILGALEAAILTNGPVFYKNGNAIPVKLFWARYTSAYWYTSSPKTGRIESIVYPGQSYDIYVDIASDSNPAFIAKGKAFPIFKAPVELYTRICSGASCPSPNDADVTVASTSDISSITSKLPNYMFCGMLPAKPTPFEYTSDQNKKQCGCKCPTGFVGNNDQCVCPGELEPVGTGCGCTNGRTQTADNKCVCTGGREYSAASKSCVCPIHTTLSGDVCVKNCYWKASNEGFSCLWKDRAKTALKLKTDCSVSAPVAKDNYVADKRVNKFDPANPETYGSPSANPKISVTATKKNTPTETQTKATTWLNYMLAPGDLEDAVQLGSFGVFDLSMTATDYRYQATCPGCVAVVDDYPPTPKDLCGTTDTRTTTNIDYSTTALSTVIADETSFTNFYGSANVLNNGDETAAGDNKRCDVEAMEVTDFFKTAPTTSTSVSPKCFTNSLVSDLLTSAKDASLSSLESLVQSTPMGTLTCKRCCFKSIVLKEHFAKYECGITSPVWEKQGESNCKYGRCMTVQPKDLITATAKTTDGSNTKTSTTLGGLPTGSESRTDAKYIHRSVTCTKWSENCKVEPKLGDIISTKAEWKAAVTGFNVDEFVFWRYKIGSSGTWTAWNGETVLSFKDESTTIAVEAYSRCGKLLDTSFEFVIHLHTDRVPCQGFTERFVDNAPVPTKVDSNICAYPKSDFALLTFNYDSSENVPHDAGKVKGKYTDISCTVTVAEAGAVATTSPLTMSLPAADTNGLIKFGKQFALELVKDPTTAMNTDVKFVCTIKFKYFDDDKVDTDTCTADLRLTDCDGPKLQTYSTDAVCVPGKCGSPAGPPGLFETCAGEVFTTTKSGTVVSTTSRTASSPCCTECSTTLTCTALAQATNGLKRCEPPANYEMLLALATDKTQTVAEGVQPSSSMVTMLLSASAMVAVVALVAATAMRRSHAKAQSVAVDDAYMSLMD